MAVKLNSLLCMWVILFAVFSAFSCGNEYVLIFRARIAGNDEELHKMADLLLLLPEPERLRLASELISKCADVDLLHEGVASLNEETEAVFESLRFLQFEGKFSEDKKNLLISLLRAQNVRLQFFGISLLKQFGEDINNGQDMDGYIKALWDSSSYTIRVLSFDLLWGVMSDEEKASSLTKVKSYAGIRENIRLAIEKPMPLWEVCDHFIQLRDTGIVR